jgi:hypothetical protein
MLVSPSSLAALAGALLLPFLARAAEPLLITVADPSPAAGDEPAIAALALALALSPAPALDPVEGEGDPAATVELVATVRARAVSFPEVPRVRIGFTGSGPARTTWHTERVNLPARPAPGVVYRDVEVRLALTGPPDEIAALLADGRRLAEGLTIERDGASALLVTPEALPAAARAGAVP